MKHQLTIGAILTALGCLFCQHGQAQQTVKSTPLHRFFQQHYDSTIIWQSGSAWNNAPHYLILAKYKDQVYFFTYMSPYHERLGKYYPGGLAKKMALEDLRFRTTIPDTNRYLLPQNMLPRTLSQCWRQLNPSQLWTALQDDLQAGSAAGKCGIDDGDDNVFYLLDRRTSKTAAFYAPAYWEECLGKDPNRQQAIRVRAALQALLVAEPSRR
jgi:hypothetical protein